MEAMLSAPTDSFRVPRLIAAIDSPIFTPLGVATRNLRSRHLQRARLWLPHRAQPKSYVAWLPLPDDARADRVAATLAGQGIAVSTAEPFATTTHVPQALRLALGSTTHDRLRDALGVVRRVVEEDAAS